MTMTAKLTTELKRLGLALKDVQDVGDGVSLVQSPDWPDTVRYRTALAVECLSAMEDGSAVTEDGDAEMCRRLESYGAFIGLGV